MEPAWYLSGMPRPSTRPSIPKIPRSALLKARAREAGSLERRRTPEDTEAGKRCGGHRGLRLERVTWVILSGVLSPGSGLRRCSLVVRRTLCGAQTPAVVADSRPGAPSRTVARVRRVEASRARAA